MKELESLFEALYSRFILRDVFGKIVPGVTLLLSLYIAFIRPDICPEQAISLLKSLRFSTWIILGGIAWVTAFGIQRVAELLRLLRYYGDWIQDDKSWYAMIVRFNEVATPVEKSNLERFVVIKEACGNTAMSFILSALILLIPLLNQKKDIGILVALFLGGVILLCMHRVHVKRNTWWLESVLEFRGKPEKGQPYQPPSEKIDKNS